MKKWKISLFLFLFVFFIITLSKQVHAQGFPNDAKEFDFDSIDNTTCTSSTAILMPAVNHHRKLLHFAIDNLSSKVNNGADVHLYNYGETFPNQFVDNEKQTYTSNFLAHELPANIAVTCQKGTTAGERSDHIFFSIIYADYNLSSSTPAVYGTATTTAMNTSIDTIGYIATTTTLSSGVQFTQAEYSLPFALFAFIFAIIIVLVITFFGYYYIRKSNAD